MNNDNVVIRIFFAKMKKAYLDLPEEDKLEFMQKDRANLDGLEMKAISMVDCSESNDDWDYVGVESWPSEEAIKNREIFEREELQLSKYVEYKVIVGREMHFEEYGR